MSAYTQQSSKYYVKVSAREKAAYGAWGFGSDLVFQTINLFLMFFYTDIFGLSPAAVALLFLVARAYDAVIDPLVGTLVERAHFRFGKFKSWLIYLSVPYGISTVLLFTVPDSDAMKLAFAWVTYLVFGTIFAGLVIPATGLSSSITQDPQERTVLNSFRMFCSQLGGVAASLLVPYLSASLGATPAQGYQYAMIILSIVMVITFLITGIACQERVPETDTDEKFKVKDILKQITMNRPLLYLFALFLGAYTFNIMISSSGTYFITYNMNMPDLLGLFSLIQVLPSVIPMLFIPALVRRLGKKTVAYVGTGVALLGAVLFFVSPTSSMALMFTWKGLASFGYGIVLGVLWAMLPDTVEYGEYATGRRAGGVVFSLASFGIKVALTIAGIVPSIVLGMVNYVPNVVQSDSALFAIKALNSIIPAAILLVTVLVFTRYSLDKEHFDRIVVELHKRHADRALGQDADPTADPNPIH